MQDTTVATVDKVATDKQHHTDAEDDGDVNDVLLVVEVVHTESAVVMTSWTIAS